MRHLIIDGYNVIRQTPPYRDLADRGDWDLARDTLVGDVAAYVTSSDRATVVFDGTRNPLSDGDPVQQLGVEVIFSPFGQTADTVIERISSTARERGDSVTVVTSDAQTQWTVMGEGVVRRASREFREHLADECGDTEAAGRMVTSRVTLVDQISPDARQMLENLRMGRSANSAPRTSDDEQEGGDQRGC